MSKKEHSLWKEAKRPSTLEGYICSDLIRFQMEKYIRKGTFPHMVFYGETGTGKTTLAKILVNNVNCDYLYINASDENGIDTVRNKITNFVSAASFKPLKVVILDDCYNITTDFQQALLNTLEQYSINSRFIFTTNHVEKMIPALAGRLIQYEIKPPSKKEVKIHIATILEQEGISFDPKDVTSVVNRYFPSIRMCIDNTQNMIDGNNLVLNFSKAGNASYMVDIVELLKSPDKNTWQNIRQVIVDQELQDYTEVFRGLYDRIDQYVTDKGYEEVVFAISQAQFQQSFVADRELNAAEMFLKIIQALK